MNQFARSLVSPLLVLLAFSLALPACGGDQNASGDIRSRSQSDDATNTHDATNTNSADNANRANNASDEDWHAPAGYVPGSWEDWCGGHGVQESVCTRCNASLIPAFQATGDWCAEHGIPESQCKICNPELVIQRPPRQEGE